MSIATCYSTNRANRLGIKNRHSKEQSTLYQNVRDLGFTPIFPSDRVLKN